MTHNIIPYLKAEQKNILYLYVLWATLFNSMPYKVSRNIFKILCNF